MTLYRPHPKNILLFFGALFLATAVKYVPAHILHPHAALVVQYVIYCLMIQGWGRTVLDRVYNTHIIIYARILVIAFILMLALRVMRHTAYEGVFPWERVLWYWYYLPALAIPMISFFMSCYIGKPEGWHMPRKVFLLLIPYLALFVTIVSNDSHQLAFRFKDLNATSLDGGYRVGILYIVAQIWMMGFAIMALIQLYHVCKKAGLPAYITAPAVIVGLGILHTILYATFRTTFVLQMVDARAMTVVVTIGVWETCLSTELLPNNRHHIPLFTASTVPMEIADESGFVQFISAGLRRGALLEEGKLFRMRKYDIPAGSLRWYEDVTEAAQILKQTEENAAERERLNHQLEVQTMLKKDAEKAEARARVYDRALRVIRPQMKLLEDGIRALQGLPEKEIKRLLPTSCVYAAYIKRRSNLTIISDGVELLPVQELHFCLRETAEALAMVPVGVIYQQSMEDGRMIMPVRIAEVYDAIEQEIEKTLSVMDRILIRLTCADDATNVVMEIEGRGIKKIERRWAL